MRLHGNYVDGQGSYLVYLSVLHGIQIVLDVLSPEISIFLKLSITF
jgi:hypothetical protein